MSEQFERAPDGRLIISFDDLVDIDKPEDGWCCVCGERIDFWLIPRELGPDFAMCSLCDDIAPITGRTPVQYWNVPNRILLSIGWKMIAHLEGKPFGARIRRQEESMRRWQKTQERQRAMDRAKSLTASRSGSSSPA